MIDPVCFVTTSIYSYCKRKKTNSTVRCSSNEQKFEHYLLPFEAVQMNANNCNEFLLVLYFLEPWIVRKYMRLNKEWKSLITAELPNIDITYMKLKKEHYNKYDLEERYEWPCHSTGTLRFPYDYFLIVDHNCIDNRCSVPCHRNNDFGCVHWDITTNNCRPLKCMVCGQVFVNRETVKKSFFLRDNEIKYVTRYRSRLDYRMDTFNLQEIQWMALIICGSVSPTYRPSKSRCYRESLTNSIVDKISVPTLFSRDALLNTLPFRYYLQGKWKVRVVTLFERYHRFIPVFLDFSKYWMEKQEEWTPGLRNSIFFSDVTSVTVITHGFSQMLQQSLVWFLGESIYNDDVFSGLVRARAQILDVYRRKGHDVLSNLTPYLIMNHSTLNSNITEFKKGVLTIDGLIECTKECIMQDRRRYSIHAFLHRRGIHHESFRCECLKSYIETKSVSRYVVLRCMKKHVSSCKMKCLNMT